MRIHVTNDVGDVHQLDVDGQMELVNLAALIEAEMSIPTQQQAIYHNGAQLTDMTKSILGAGIRQDDILLVRGAPPAAAGHSRAAARSPQETAEVVRNQILADPHMLRQLQQSNPQLAAAAQNDPVTFRQMFIELESRRREFEERQRQQEEMLYNSDPFDAEAQKRIEEAIRQQNIAQNMENAMEYHPESFGNVSRNAVH
ncbi:uncharacterized protein EV422DRAFT_276877 [Fimicolochytrium jonesii]|uniref:uncharacterized protein n=1 Tax=Fimicolochytrium jonesii TaxID=1396493 RepID=UPI0022FEB30A|nr:uncharacterized protein EV422DRAFT_276877 [Fimicolochytrium jonesii]KAI8816734.1 hypothetical protein EV422DRAFT_276877 [Fimicolochytrium jonesii]